jgi:hypothetical protein
MLAKAVFLHLRWSGLFAFVAIVSTVFGVVQNRDAGRLGDVLFWWDLWPTIAACVALGIAVPWIMFMIDPRRSEPVTLAAMLRYWKAL